MLNCTNPTLAWRLKEQRSPVDGLMTSRITFSIEEATRFFLTIGYPAGIDTNCIQLPCGKCAACQIRKRKEWTARLSCEARMYDQVSFLTLTYNEDSLPLTDLTFSDDPWKLVMRGNNDAIKSIYPVIAPTLYIRDVQLFFKRLRRRVEYHGGGRLRYYVVGEYGGRTHRPHYHALVFGWKPDDVRVHQVYRGRPIYRSPLLEDLWTYGYSSVCEANPQMIRYCARYVTKKFARLSGSRRPFDDFVMPEFYRASNRGGGIGSPWLDANSESLKRGFITLPNGENIVKYGIPQYFMSYLRKNKPEIWLKVRDIRKSFIKLNKQHSQEDNTYNIIQSELLKLERSQAVEVF